MAKKKTVEKIFPLLVINNEDDDSQRPYIARTHVLLALQTLQIIAAHVMLGDTNVKELSAKIDELHKELSNPVVIGE